MFFTDVGWVGGQWLTAVVRLIVECENGDSRESP